MDSASSVSDRTAHTHSHRSRELFICFMKTSSKLRASGSIKSGHGSPMFNNKKRGSGFENGGSNPEPSSPKVTCIGQVRVKTKKQGEKMRNLSRRRSGEVSFRKIEHNVMQRQSSVNSIHHQQECASERNQRWVHLPLTICETLRGFGSEFSCLFPCKSSCFSGEREVGRESRDDLVKWLNDEGGFEDEKVVRRHVFDEIEIKDCNYDEGGRVSVCVPPKNALLLMRCRSDPVKMEALANKVWEPKLEIDEDEDEESGDFNDENDEGNSEIVGTKNNYCRYLDGHVEEEHVNLMVSFDKVKVVEVFEERRASVSYNIVSEENQNVSDMKMEIEVQGNEEDLNVNEEMHDNSEQEELEDSQEVKVGEQKEEKDGSNFVSGSFFVHLDDEACEQGQKEQEKQESEDASVTDQNEPILKNEQEEKNKDGALQGMENGQELEREGDRNIKTVGREATQRLPECLLLMMCEPKLSMEVSKETWVCSTDFIRSRPPKKKSHAPHAPPQHKKSSTGDEEPVIKKRNSVDSKSNNPFAALPPPYPVAQNIQPGRSSCCLSEARGVSMASTIEQKLGDAVAYEPVVLTRCKSEPMRTASKLAQEACFWKNKALEPHRRATFGVGAAGVGC